MVAAFPAHRRGMRLGTVRRDESAHPRRDRGEIKIPLDHDRIFTLSARADRIEHPATDFALLDYKTGQPPTGKQVRMGLSPQLTLEAAILREGGFAGIAAGAPSANWSMSGSAATIRPAKRGRLN